MMFGMKVGVPEENTNKQVGERTLRVFHKQLGSLETLRKSRHHVAIELKGLIPDSEH
jgi:hypothetical protein